MDQEPQIQVPGRPWQISILLVSNLVIPSYSKQGNPGRELLNHRDQVQPETPVVIEKYGSGERPAIHGDATVNCTVEPGETKYCTVYLFNQEYW